MTALARKPDEMYHRWEDAGVGHGPYRFLGMFAFPSPSLAEANIFAYQNALAELAAAQKSLGVSGGCCQVCGNVLMNNYVFQNADGRRFVVGCDCAEKAGELTSAVLQAKKRHDRAVEAARTRARNEQAARDWQAVLDANGWDGFVAIDEFISTSRKTFNRRYDEERARMAREAADRNAWLIKTLKDVPSYGDFIPSMIDRLQHCFLSEFSSRQVNILCDIYAKHVSDGARRNSKAYGNAVDSFYSLAGIEE